MLGPRAQTQPQGEGGLCPARQGLDHAGLGTESVSLKAEGVELSAAFLNHGFIREQITYV